MIGRNFAEAFVQKISFSFGFGGLNLWCSPQAAILEDGSVVCWGDPRNGGDNSEVQQHLKDVVSIAATSFAFAAILADQSDLTLRDLFGVWEG